MKFKKSIESDTSITSIQYHSYAPYTQSFNHQDEIRIVVQSQNSYLLLCDSNLYIEGEINRRANLDNAILNPQLLSNYASFLFDSMRYELNGTEIDKCKNVGITSTLKMIASLTRSDVIGLYAAGLAPSENARAERFALEIPMKLFMGFFEDYKNVIMNSKHELFLIRSRNDTNCFTGTHDACTITIGKIMWRIPHIKVDDYTQLKMLKQIESNESIPLAYRSWDYYEYPALPQSTRHVWAVKTTSHLTRPRYVLLAFQTNRNFQITANNIAFDHLSLTDARLYLNSECYPQESIQTNFTDTRGVIAYNMYIRFKETYYHCGSGRPSNPIMTYAEWMASPIFVFDCSRQNESLKNSAVDVKFEFETSQNVPAHTAAYCIIIHDNIVQYNPLTNIVMRGV